MFNKQTGLLTLAQMDPITYIQYPKYIYCQAQPKLKSKLEAEMAIFSIITTTQPPTHPDKFKFGIGQHNSQKQSCLPI